jgi:lipopolysaccharide transport system ATP-binding protein
VQSVNDFVRSARSLADGHQLLIGDEVEEFWALRDVDFEIKRGDVVGIIGRNGAGKSTLLKVLSRITEPTEGRAEIRGRVSSLLEVGTGFHPELTGRENVFLNGAILGMTRAEIRRKFDEIVDFAGVEKFIDTPIKRFSSGMQVRLAFAVAAYLEPEILIVDEILAVGDAEFQRKCIGRMQDIGSGGRTVLFVSHNRAAITSFCKSAVYLKDGKVFYNGSVSNSFAKYDQDRLSELQAPIEDRKVRIGSGSARLKDISFGCNEALGRLSSGERASFKLRIWSQCSQAAEVSIDFYDPSAQPVFTVNTNHSLGLLHLSEGGNEVVCEINELPLLPGRYIIGVRVGASGEHYDWVREVAEISVEPSDVFGNGKLPVHGIVYVRSNWHIS